MTSGPGAASAPGRAQLQGLARNHPCVDGNRRTAFVAVELFLALNGFELTAEDPD